MELHMKTKEIIPDGFHGECFGAIPSQKDIRDYKIAASRSLGSPLPDSYRLDIPKVKNQGSKPTCVPHTLASIIEYHNVSEGNTYVPFSTEFIYGCRFDIKNPYSGEGMRLRDALHIVNHYGDVIESRLPGNSLSKDAIENVTRNFDEIKEYAYPNRITAYYKITSIDELKYSLYTDGPVICCMKWYDGTTADKSGFLRYDDTKTYQHHAVMVIGWDETCWVVQNSWGIQWGNRGVFRIPINTGFQNIFEELYGITDDIQSVVTPDIVTTKLSLILNLFINLIVNILRRISSK